ncbi:CsiV family protein [Panacagrimonas sp.]|uniref:CsiV family protein n=1 Tax=Panacagrimonas sp. TaxID=2480088 RepID=UPI003B51FB18
MPRTVVRRRLATRLLLLLTCLLPLPALADTWRVDLLVFRYLRPVDEQGLTPAPPNLRNAIELDDTAALSRAGITLLPESEFALADHWTQLRRSAQFRPLIRLAWTQNDPPSANGPRLRLKGGEELVVADESGMGARQFNEIDGSVALHLGRFLHLDTDMVYTAPGADATSWTLSESRRMRSEELHHLDSPRLAAIVRVVRWGSSP